MNEDRAATDLARWLDASPGEAPPEGIDPDVAAAVYALRPDRAPPPRVDIDAVLRDLESGPLATPPSPEEIAEASRFRDWLDGEDVEGNEEVLSYEAAIALRPELAPPARVTVDDFLPALSEPELRTVEAANRVPGGGRRGMWMWVLPGAGALLMAALALIVVLPMAQEAPRGFPEPTASAPRDAEPIPEVAAAPAPVTALPDAPREEERQAPAAEPAAQGGGGFGVLSVDSATKGAAQKDTWGEGSKAKAETPPPPMPVTTAPADTPVAVASAGPDGTATFDDRAADKKDAAEEQTVAKAPVATGSANAGLAAGDMGADEDEAAPAQPARSQTRASTKTLAAHASSAGAAKASPAPASPPAATAPAQDLVAANPDRARLSAAENAISTNNLSSAQTMLAPLLSSTDPAVVMGAALDLGRIQLAAGQKAFALATVRKGLAAGREPADLRAQLLALKAQITAMPDP